MKKIDKLVLLDFIPPYLMAFFVAEFVLVMQFLWKYIDEIIGKGFSFGVLMEMLFYFSVRIVPEAVPVTILIASVMVFGNLAEKYELSSMKSAGISLTRIMWMAILISIFTAGFSLLASNYLKPKATYKFYYRFNAIRKQKPALNIAEGVFAKDFRNFVIRVGKKAENGRDINDVIIYDHSIRDRRQIKMLIAEDGEMYASGDENFFVMELNDGEQFRELDEKKSGEKKDPFLRTKFKKWTKVFDMSEFDMEAQNLNFQRKEYDLLNSFQLLGAIDSIDDKTSENRSRLNYNFRNLLDIETFDEKAELDKKDLPQNVKEAIEKTKKQETNKPKRSSIKINPYQQIDTINIDTLETFLAMFTYDDQLKIIKGAKSASSKQQELISTKTRQDESLRIARAKYVLRLHQMYSWALICVVFLFIGAPLGSIVKKGGYGYPLLIAIVFFMLFIILNILGERLNKGLTINPIFAAWLPNIVIIPVAALFTYRALNDMGFPESKELFLKVKKRFFKDKTVINT